MPLFGKKEPPQDPKQEAMLREYEAYEDIMYEVKAYIVKSYLLSLLDYWFKHNEQMTHEQHQSLLVGIITRVQNDLQDEYLVIFKNPRLSFELENWRYTSLSDVGLGIPDDPAFGDALFREELERKALNSFGVNLAWTGAWLQIAMKKVKWD